MFIYDDQRALAFLHHNHIQKKKIILTICTQKIKVIVII